VASIEVGAGWVGYCMHELDHAGSNLVERRITTFDGELVGAPSEVFKKHCFMSRRSPRRTSKRPVPPRGDLTGEAVTDPADPVTFSCAAYTSSRCT